MTAFTLRETLSNLCNAGVVAGTLIVAAFVPPPATAYVQHNGFACVRPSYVLNSTGSQEFAGYRLCHETLPVDKNGYVVFPKA